MSGQQLLLAPTEPALELELVDGTITDEVDDVAVIAAPAPTELEARNLFGEAERIAARAASASTRRQYASIFRAFGDWLAGELGRPPVVGDLDTDAIAAYGRHLAVAGGRGGRPAAPATSRVYLSMIRALARDLGREDQADGVRVPRYEPGPPETLTDTDYANLLRVPDRRTLAGKRDYALLRVLGDCGLRSAPVRQARPSRTRTTLSAVRCRRNTGSCAEAVHLREYPSGSRTRTRSGPTGLPTAWRPVYRCTRCRLGSGTSTCGPLPAMPRPGRSARMRSPLSWTVAIRPPGVLAESDNSGQAQFRRSVAGFSVLARALLGQPAANAEPEPSRLVARQRPVPWTSA
jgi:hypothetical protein